MMLRAVLALSIRMSLFVAILPSLGWGQQPTVALSLSQFVSSGEGVARQCYQPQYGTGLGARLSVPVLTRWTRLQVAGRGYWLNRGSACETIGPPDGTFIEDDRVNLLTRSFVTTDVRLATQLGEARVNFALGVGNAWHRGHNLPYLVAAAGIPLLKGPNSRLNLNGEFQWLRVSSDRVRRTYLNESVVAEEPLGRVHRWSHGFILGLTLGNPL